MPCKTPKNRITLIKSIVKSLVNSATKKPIEATICNIKTVFFSVFIFSNL